VTRGLWLRPTRGSRVIPTSLGLLIALLCILPLLAASGDSGDPASPPASQGIVQDRPIPDVPLISSSGAATSAGGAAIVTPLAPVPTGGECAAVSCDRESPSSTVPLPTITLASTIAAGSLVLLALFAVRRARRTAGTLPAGTPSPLFRPPQHLCA
jgi:hypothetical protein